MVKINHAMLLAAGFGTRMKPLSDTTPKPLIEIGGQPQIKYIYDTVTNAGIENIVVNAHHHKEQVVSYFADFKNTTVVVEDEILETGGGVLNELDNLGEAFVVSNTDSIVIDNNKNFINHMIENFTDDIDGLLLMVDKTGATNYTGSGDVDIDELGNITRNQNGQYVFCGVQILRKSAFEGVSSGNFSLNVIYDKLIGAGKLKAIVHTGDWYHISTPEDVEKVNKIYQQQGGL